MITAAALTEFDPVELRKAVLATLEREARPLGLGEIAALTGQPPHRVLLVLDMADRDGEAFMAADRTWYLNAPFGTPAFPPAEQQALTV